MLKLWCWVCHMVREHEMQTEEVGNCIICGTRNWVPQGDID